MKTHEFLTLLEQQNSKSLLFEYMPQQLIGANYHITEVKHTRIDAVDCGARLDSWNETVVQLWESPAELDKTAYMNTTKALSILNRVGAIKPYDLESEIRFEYGNSQFHTAHLFVNDHEINNDQLIFKLSVVKTDCKAKDECGVPEEALAQTADACCTPESGCC